MYLHIYIAWRFTNSILPCDTSSNSEMCHYLHSVDDKLSQEPRNFSKHFITLPEGGGGVAGARIHNIIYRD